MPRRRLGFAIAASSLGVAFACSRFDAASPAATADEGGLPEAGADVTTDDSGVVPAIDDAGGEESGGPLTDGTYLPCPPTRAAVSYATDTILAHAPSADVGIEFPFQVTTDKEYVYWIAQYAARSDSAAVGFAYNGTGPGRLRRVAKGAVKADADVLVDNLPMAEAAALDGDYVYFTYLDGGGTVVARVTRDCTTPCTPDTVRSESSLSSRIVRMYRAAPGVLVLRAEDGRAFVFQPNIGDDGPTPWLELYNPGGNGFAVTNEDIFLANADNREFFRSPLGGPATKSAEFSPLHDQQGASPIATNCQSVFAFRKNKSVWQSPRDSLSFADWTGPLDVANEVYELVADADYVYLGQPNGFGILAVPIAGGSPKRVSSMGGYWYLAVDDSGLYGGDHSYDTGGAMHHFH